MTQFNKKDCIKSSWYINMVEYHAGSRYDLRIIFFMGINIWFCNIIRKKRMCKQTTSIINHYVSYTWLNNVNTQNTWFYVGYIDGLVQDCSNLIAKALELLQPSTKPSICCFKSIHNIASIHRHSICCDMNPALKYWTCVIAVRHIRKS